MDPDITPQLAALYDRYLQERAELDPNWATMVGIHDHDRLLTRFDDASHDARVKFADTWLEKVPDGTPQRHDGQGCLLPGDSLDARLWRSELLSMQFEYRRRDARRDSPALPFGAIAVIHDMSVKDFAPLAERMENLNARLRDIPAMIEEVRSRLDRPPRSWTESAFDDGEGALAFLDELKGADAELVAAARSAFASYLEFLRKELLSRSDGTFAIGREAYEFHLRTENFLGFGADELLRIGHEEFARTVKMLEEVDGDWPATLEMMKKDHPAADELIEVYRKEAARTRQFMIDRDLVGIPDGEKMEIVETPAFERSSIPYAAYSRPGPLDSARTGHFYVTPVSPDASSEEAEAQLAGHNVYDMPGTVWHEAYPGHHLQFVYAKGVNSKVRRLNESPLLSEGWGLYCEELAHETGYFKDRRERLMQLNWRLQRAARIILDVSLHVGEMKFDEAVDFLVKRVGLNRVQAVGSVNGYTQWPTYFPMYLLGMVEIMRIREGCRSRLGDRFTLREFHERFMAYGNVPPGLIEPEITASWQ